MQLELAAQAQRLTLTYWHGIVELEDVVGGLIRIIREAVSQVDIVRGNAKVIRHLRGGRTVVQLIGQRQTLGVVLIEEALVVDASIKRGTRHLHVCGTAVVETSVIAVATQRRH